MKMNKKINSLMIGIFFSSLIGCTQGDMFEKEQYKKVVYVLSESDKTFPVVHSLNETKSTGHLTVYVGGTLATDKDVTVTFEKDTSMLLKYNLSNFDIDTDKYAVELDTSRYEIPNYSVTLKAGSEYPYARLPIVVTPEGLSPDSVYMISLRIKDVSEFEINKEKDNVMYRLYLKNDFAEQQNVTTLFMRGTETTEGSKPKQISANKVLHPLTGRTVRVNAGMLNSANKAEKDLINQSSLIMEISKEEEVSIQGATYNPLYLKPYKNNLIEVVQIGKKEEDGTTLSVKESNRYITEYGITRYYLCYKFRTVKEALADGTPTEWNEWIEISENLKVPTL